MENSVGNPIQKPIVNQNQVTQPVINQPVVTQQQGSATVPIQANGQTVQVPNYSGVNIQIFNPTVATPGSNINAPQYYPPNYYTEQLGNPQQSGINDVNGNSANGINGNSANSVNGANGTNDTNNTNNTNNVNNVNNTNDNTKKEKRDIVLLTDDYIKSVENYLNSQDKEIRLMGAKEVVARLQEDDSRKDDKALIALVNKMLQDPSQQVRILALSMLSGRKVNGDEFTKQVLQQMQSSTAGYGQDALLASDILLKMSGQVVQKEFEVKDTEKKKGK